MTRWSRILGDPGPVDQRWSGINDGGLPQAPATVTEAQVAVAVRRAESILPGSPTCLAQAAAAQVMLRRRGEPGTVLIGLRRIEDAPDGAWEAHAWLVGMAGALTGGPAAAGFAATTSFQPSECSAGKRRQSAAIHPRPGPFLAWATAAVIRMELGYLDAWPDPLRPGKVQPMVADLCRAAAFHGVEQVLAPHSAILGFDAAATKRLQIMAKNSQLAGLTAVADTVRVSAALQGAGIAHLILNGFALAVQTTDSPAGRGESEVSVLVQSGEVSAAIAVLLEAGLTGDSSTALVPGSGLLPDALRTRSKAVLWIERRSVTLHWRLDDAQFCQGWELAKLMSSAEWLSVGGGRLPTLSRKHAAVFAASRSARDAGWVRLGNVVDQARSMRGLDRGELRKEAWHMGAGRRMELAFAMVDLLTGEPDTEVPPAIRALAERMWRRSRRAHESYDHRGPGAVLISLGTEVYTQDSLRGAWKRAATAVLPSVARGSRSYQEVPANIEHQRC